jgi:hypothetical protein
MLPMPNLMLHALQVNIAGGRLPDPEANGTRYLKLPLREISRPLAMAEQGGPKQTDLQRFVEIDEAHGCWRADLEDSIAVGTSVSCD